MSHLANTQIQDKMAEDYAFYETLKAKNKGNYSAVDILRSKQRQLQEKYNKWFNRK